MTASVGMEALVANRATGSLGKLKIGAEN